VRVSHFCCRSSFDGALRDIFVPLCVGGTLCVPWQRELVLDGRALLQWLDAEQITLVHCVPSDVPSAGQRGQRKSYEPEKLEHLQYVVLAGEA